LWHSLQNAINSSTNWWMPPATPVRFSPNCFLHVLVQKGHGKNVTLRKLLFWTIFWMKLGFEISGGNQSIQFNSIQWFIYVFHIISDSTHTQPYTHTLAWITKRVWGNQFGKKCWFSSFYGQKKSW
jgi:hypothetical protein